MAYTEKDWIHRTLQFLLGAVLGAAGGVAVWKDYPDVPLWLCAAGGALVLGTVAAIVGDKLWRELLRHWRGW